MGIYVNMEKCEGSFKNGVGAYSQLSLQKGSKLKYPSWMVFSKGSYLAHICESLRKKTTEKLRTVRSTSAT